MKHFHNFPTRAPVHDLLACVYCWVVVPQCYGGHLAWTSEVGTAVAFLSVMSVDTEKSSQKHGSSSGNTNEKDGPCKYKAMRWRGGGFS